MRALVLQVRLVHVLGRLGGKAVQVLRGVEVELAELRVPQQVLDVLLLRLRLEDDALAGKLQRHLLLERVVFALVHERRHALHRVELQGDQHSLGVLLQSVVDRVRDFKGLLVLGVREVVAVGREVLADLGVVLVRAVLHDARQLLALRQQVARAGLTVVRQVERHDHVEHLLQVRRVGVVCDLAPRPPRRPDVVGNEAHVLVAPRFQVRQVAQQLVVQRRRRHVLVLRHRDRHEREDVGQVLCVLLLLLHRAVVRHQRGVVHAAELERLGDGRHAAGVRAQELGERVNGQLSDAAGLLRDALDALVHVLLDLQILLRQILLASMLPDKARLVLLLGGVVRVPELLFVGLLLRVLGGNLYFDRLLLLVSCHGCDPRLALWCTRFVGLATYTEKNRPA
eukprot:Rhum_TRINITY_DN13446_c0_g2::Rhum_TRINITY_DN13446_c0_g2_i1::g.60469::m.60469